MKKLLPIFLGTIIISLLFLQINHPKPSVAQGPTGNQAGINIVDPDVNRFLQAAQTVGPGGWVTVVATAGQGAQLQQIFDANHSLGDQKVQVVIRRETWERAPTAQDALSFTTMYGNLDTHGQQIYDMPWNEPNNFAWWGFSTTDQAARVGANYFRSSYQTLEDSGLYGEKVIFMAPMVDQFYGNGPEFYQLLKTYDPNVMNYFQAVPMNLYVRYDPNTNNPSSYFIDSGIGYREVLKAFGFSNFSNIPVLALETGVIVGAGNPIYPPSYPGWLNFYNFLNYVTSTWRADPNFFGFTPLSSPSFGNDYLLREFAAILQQFVTPGAVGIYDLSEIQRIFEEWLKTAGLIECFDDEGNLIGYAIDEKGCEDLLSLLPQPTYPACTAPSSETQVSRPDMCSTCDLNPPLTYACATTFAVEDTVGWHWEDSDFICDPTGKHWVSRDWGGIITIDPSEVKVPFVGKKGAEDVKDYLADYFEGTAFYYGPDVDLEDCKKDNPNEAERKACQEEVKRITAEGGVFRKLAPRDYQDKLKKEMIQRAKDSKAGRIEHGIHDYLIKHAGYEMRLSQIVPPPDSPEAREGWEKTPSGKLWAAVPMFSREDSPGDIFVDVNKKRLDETIPPTPVEKVEKVPHLARLFEVTRELQQLLMPWIKEEQAKTPTLLASSNPSVLGEKTLLAQNNPPPPNPGFEAHGSCSKSGNAYSVNAIVSLTNAPGLRDISIHIGSWSWDTCPNSKTCTNLDAPTYTVTGSPGDIKSGPTFHFRADNVVPNFLFSGTYSVKLTADGCEFVSGPGQPPAPSCGLVEPVPYGVCDFESITDENPNDTICCEAINIELSAVDQFENPNYTGPCIYVRVCDPICHRDLLNPECKKKEERDVSRQVKIDLYHPYLNEIWEQTTDSFRGLFNIFRPSTVIPFRDLDAHSYINYSFTGASISPPPPWKFYFPHLGGIQEAKEWVLQTLNPSGEGGGRPLGPAAPPSGPTTLYYTIDFRNSGITISDEAKNYVIQQVKSSWPDTKIETYWDYVYSEAKSWGWNPAFVIALWIEESGASGKDAYDLGCLGAPRNDLAAQLNCLFTRPYAYKSFEEFMCMYSEGDSAPCLFKLNPDFPRGVKYWYDLLIQ